MCQQLVWKIGPANVEPPQTKTTHDNSTEDNCEGSDLLISATVYCSVIKSKGYILA